MEFYGAGHVFKCVPTVLGISTEWEKYQKAVKEAQKDGTPAPEEFKPVIFGMKCMSMPEIDEDAIREAQTRGEKTADEAQRIIAGFTKSRIASKVVSIENLTVDGKEVTDFDTFYDVAPPELVSWVCKSIYSSFILSRAEIKN